MLLRLGKDLLRRLRRAFTAARVEHEREVTVVLTSCGREDLLRQTIESFLQFNTYPIKELILIEDSGATGVHEHYKRSVPFPVRTIYNERTLGQIRSVDVAYSFVSTPYIFHCEDDWEFFKPGFIERSMRILEADPKVVTVWLRAHDDTGGHPIEPERRGHYRYMALDYGNCWNGFTFNPGLRRTRDYARFAPYSDLEVLFPKGEKREMLLAEADLSMYHKLFGYRGAITLDPDGYVRHIGAGRHVKEAWEERA